MSRIDILGLDAEFPDGWHNNPTHYSDQPSVWEHLGGRTVADQTPWFDSNYPNLVNRAKDLMRSDMISRLKYEICSQKKSGLTLEGHVILSVLTKSWAAPWTHDVWDGFTTGTVWDDAFGDPRQSIWSGAAKLGKFWFRTAPQKITPIKGLKFCHSKKSRCCQGYHFTAKMELRDSIGPYSGRSVTRASWIVGGTFSCCSKKSCDPILVDSILTALYD